MPISQFYERMKNDKISLAKCEVQIKSTNECLQFYKNYSNQNIEDLCQEFKTSWILCLKHQGISFFNQKQ